MTPQEIFVEWLLNAFFWLFSEYWGNPMVIIVITVVLGVYVIVGRKPLRGSVPGHMLGMALLVVVGFLPVAWGFTVGLVLPLSAMASQAILVTPSSTLTLTPMAVVPTRVLALSPLPTYTLTPTPPPTIMPSPTPPPMITPSPTPPPMITPSPTPPPMITPSPTLISMPISASTSNPTSAGPTPVIPDRCFSEGLRIEKIEPNTSTISSKNGLVIRIWGVARDVPGYHFDHFKVEDIKTDERPAQDNTKTWLVISEFTSPVGGNGHSGLLAEWPYKKWQDQFEGNEESIIVWLRVHGFSDKTGNALSMPRECFVRLELTR